jgi:hypothetical protein
MAQTNQEHHSLEHINFDDKSYDELLKEAMKQIALLSGGNWTDYNAHDPGITFLELLTWLTEMQRYHLNRITDKHRLKYLKLLSTEPRKAILARLPVILDEYELEHTIPKGTTTDVGGVTFTTAEDILLNDYEITLFHSFEDIECSVYGFKPFGESPKAGNCFYMKFSSPISKQIRLYFKLAPQDRVPMEAGYCQLASVKCEIEKNGEFHECVVTDTTYGFMQSGYLTITPTFSGDLLRINLAHCELDVAPTLEWLSPRYTELNGNTQVKENISFTIGGFDAHNPLTSYGNSEAETIEQAFARVRVELGETYRAVTLADYETLVRQTPGIRINNINVYSPQSGKVCICINNPCDSYKKNIRQYLFPRKLVCTEIEIVEPVLWEGAFRGVIILQNWALSKQGEIRGFIKEKLQDFQREFGIVISLPLWAKVFEESPYIEKIKSLSLIRNNGETASMVQDVELPPNGLLRIINFELDFRN